MLTYCWNVSCIELLVTEVLFVVVNDELACSVSESPHAPRFGDPSRPTPHGPVTAPTTLTTHSTVTHPGVPASPTLKAHEKLGPV